MSFRRIFRYLFPALIYGGIINPFLLFVLAERIHGYEDSSVPGGWVIYFDVHHHHWPVAPIVIGLFVMVVIVPAVLSVALSFLRPDPRPVSFGARVALSLCLFLVMAYNAFAYVGLTFVGWNASGSF
jgi:hypothetical protein